MSKSDGRQATTNAMRRRRLDDDLAEV